MRFDRMRRRLVPALAAVLLISACQTTVFDSTSDDPSSAPPPCPLVTVVDEIHMGGVWNITFATAD